MSMALRRGLVVLLGIILQFGLSVFVLFELGEYIEVIEIIYKILSVLIVLALVKNSKNLSNDIIWIILIMLFPIVGTLLYILLMGNLFRNKRLKAIAKSIKNSEKYLVQDKKIMDEVNKKDMLNIKYLSGYMKFPVTKNNKVKYYPLGNYVFGDMINDLKSAEKFIFLEYFIIRPGKFWNSILEVLKDKASKGVDVRVVYDDMGCISTLPNSYPKKLEKLGIKCVCFNELKPLSGIFMNNRSHRKILVIDGKIGYTGGINLGDEYLNITHPYGHWKDNAIRVIGDSVYSLTLLFLTNYEAYYKEEKDYTEYKHEFNDIKPDGYTIPYGDSPLDEEEVCKSVYLNIIESSKNYVYIFTPYLIIDNETSNALVRAAKRGVDVRIVVPGIPDKKIAYFLTSSYFERLIKGGVKIYKYSKGFIHAKVFVSDDVRATVGTVNLDYRSLYLHFENGIYLEEVSTIKDIKKDTVDTIKKSKLVTKKEAYPNFFKGLWQAILRLIAPLF